MIWSFPQARLDRQLRRLHGGEHHALVDNLFGGAAQIAVGVLLHLREHELLVERAAVDADAHRLAVVACDVADGRELFVAAAAGADVAGIDAVLVERPGAVGIAGQEQMAVVVEVADERGRHAGIEHAPLDLGHRCRGFRQVDSHADHLRAGLRQLDALPGRALRIRCVRHRHRLDDDRRAAADLDGPDADPDRSMKFEDCHVDNLLIIASSGVPVGLGSCDGTGALSRRPFCKVLEKLEGLDEQTTQADEAAHSSIGMCP